ncbi:MAG: hypothetical protein ACJ8F3_05480 [Xanthobacteraceae bacterium]
MRFGDWMNKIFAGRGPAPPDLPRLSGVSEGALIASLRNIPPGERAWLPLADAARLFSSERPEYAFGEMDERGRERLDAFAAAHHLVPEFMPSESRLYLTRKSEVADRET